MSVQDLTAVLKMAKRHLTNTQKRSGLGLVRAAILLSMLPLAAVGCAGGQPMQMGTFARSVPKDQAMVVPPPAGPGIVGVVERRYDNAVDQEISLYTSAQTPGQNLLRAQFFGTVSPFQVSDNKLTSTPVTEAGVSSEMRKALPGIRMARSSFYVQNNYGPFGYAFGRGTGGDLCMYAWQQVRSPDGTISPFANYGSIQIRLRVCEANATEQQLLAIVYNYTITGAVDAGGWNPYGEPQSVSSTLGGSGAPIYPRPTANEPIVSSIPAKPATVIRRTVVARQPARPAAVRPAPVQQMPVQQMPLQQIQEQQAPIQQMQGQQSMAPLIPSPSALPTQGNARPAGSALTSSAQNPTVPRPIMANGPQPNRTAAPGALPGPTATATPRIPSPGRLPTSNRSVNVPSPSCTTTNSGAANACR